MEVPVGRDGDLHLLAMKLAVEVCCIPLPHRSPACGAAAHNKGPVVRHAPHELQWAGLEGQLIHGGAVKVLVIADQLFHS